MENSKHLGNGLEHGLAQTWEIRVSLAFSFITKNNQNQKQFLSKYLPVQFACMISDCFEPAKNKVIPYNALTKLSKTRKRRKLSDSEGVFQNFIYA